MIEITGGTVIGRDHYWNKKNNQDAFHISATPHITVGIVADGCGDVEKCPHSEVGSKVGSQFVTKILLTKTRQTLEQTKGNASFLARSNFWEQVRQDVLAKLRILALDLGDNLSEIVDKYLLFTIVGVLMTPDLSVFFSIGDGNVILNGNRVRIGPFPDNQPPYIAYGMLASRFQAHPELLSFQLNHVVPTEELESFLIGSDGVDDLINAENKPIPGKNELVGPITQFWDRDHYYLNPQAVTRRLRVINDDRKEIDWSAKCVNPRNGLLHDDTTLIAGRNKKE